MSQSDRNFDDEHDEAELNDPDEFADDDIDALIDELTDDVGQEADPADAWDQVRDVPDDDEDAGPDA